MHPSMHNPDEEDEGPDLPEGVTEEALHALVERAVEVAQRVGLHSTGHADFQQHGDTLLLGMHFAVGQLAFVTDVQDPEQAQFDDQFRKFAAGATEEQRDDILRQYLRKPDDDPGD